MQLSYDVHLFVSIFKHRWIMTGSWKNVSGVLEKLWKFLQPREWQPWLKGAAAAARLLGV